MITNNKKEKKYINFIFFNKLISFTFSLVVLIMYFSFILIIGFYPEALGIFLFDTFITSGIIIGLSIIIFSIFLTLLYTLIANNFLDKLKKEITK
tara:strand:- start:26 stop:310 length:285 start_codon:yes stop_codon:yes gene_type:complete